MQVRTLGGGLLKPEGRDGLGGRLMDDARLGECSERGGAGEEGLVEVAVKENGAIAEADGEVGERGGEGYTGHLCMLS